MTDTAEKPLMDKEEFDSYIVEKYPDIFRDRRADKTKTLMCWGFDIQAGWYTLVDELCQDLDAIQKATGIEIIAVQVKEKFGRLCFYISINYHNEDTDFSDSWYRIIYARIEKAGQKSGMTCEKCGETWTATLRRGSWLHTLCDEHAEGRPAFDKEEATGCEMS